MSNSTPWQLLISGEGILADHVEQRLPPFLFDGFERALKRPRNFMRLLDTLGVGAAGLRRKLEVGRRAKIGAGEIARLCDDAIGIQAARSVDARVPHLIIVDDGEKWNAVFLRREMTSGRRGKHVGAVPFRSNHSRFGRAEFHANGRAQSPAEMAGEWRAEQRAR